MKSKLLLTVASLALSTPLFAQDIAVIDAGSSGTRLHIYQVQPATNDDLPSITEISSAKIKPGLSSYAGNPQAAAQSTESLIKNVKIPAGDSNMPFYLMATAGMRLVSPTAQSAIYTSIDAIIDAPGSHFQRKFVGTISGKWEGLYDWMAANYLNHSLQPNKTVGVLDMGGSSTEAAFVAPMSNNTTAITLGNNTFNVNSQSFLGMGQDRARAQYTNDANCYPINYPLPSGESGTGNMAQCTNDVNALVNDVHHIQSHEQNIPTNMPFIAISGYYYTAKALGINNSFTINSLTPVATQFCATPWKTLLNEHKSDPYLPNYCFNASYMAALVANGYSFANDRSITLENSINGIDVDWTLGVALYKSMND